MMKRKTALYLLIIIPVILLSYNVKLGDTIGVDIYMTDASGGNKVMNFTSTVDIEGFAALPYAGRIKVQGLSLPEIQKIIENKAKSYLPSAIISVYLIKSKASYIYFQGALSGTIDISDIPLEERRILFLIGRLSLNSDSSGSTLTEALKYSDTVKIIRNGKIIEVNLKNFYKTGDKKYNPILQENDIVYFPTPKSVAIFGMVSKPGVYKISSTTNLLQLLSKAGAPLDKSSIKCVYIYRANKKIKIEFSEEKEKLMTGVTEGDIIEVVPYKTINIYLMGEVSKKITLSEKDSPTLRKIISNAGLSFINGIKRRIVLIRKGKEKAYNVSDPLYLPDEPLKDNDIISVYILKPVSVYVSSDVSGVKSGVITFSYKETPTLKTLLFKIGVYGNNFGIFLTTKDGTTQYISSEKIIKDNFDLPLTNYSYVYISSAPFGKINLVGFNKSSIGLLKKKETLSEVLKIAIPVVPLSDIDSFLLTKEGKVININVKDILSKGKEILLEDGDSISIKLKTEKYIYLTGDVNKVLVFSKNEEITKESILAKIGVPLDNIELLTGEPKSGSVWKIRLKKVIKVYISGNAVINKIVTLDWTELHDVKGVILKAGGLLPKTNWGGTEPKLQIKLIRNNSIAFSKTISRDDLYKLDQEVENGDILIVNFDFIKVKVFGGEKQGVYMMPKGSSFKDLILKIGGIRSHVNKVILIRDNIEKQYSIDLLKIPNFELEDNDILVFTEVLDNFIYVLGDVGSPGPIYLNENEISVLEALSLSNGLQNLESKEKLYIIRGSGKKEVYNLSYDNLPQIKIKSGDLIYIQPRTFNKVYVLGAVNRPSLVYIDNNTTLLDVIMKAGGVRKGANLSRVYVFRGGLHGTIEIYNMSWINSGRTGRNPQIKSGDVIFIPDSPYMTITEIMSFVQSAMTFVNNSINFYKNVDSLIKGK